MADAKTKKGFSSIGFLENFKSYPAQIRKLSGKDVDFSYLDDFVDNQWNEFENIICYNESCEETSAESDHVAHFLVYTGYNTEDGSEKIYGGFTATRGAMKLKKDSALWKGIEIGIKTSILNAWNNQCSQNDSNLEEYTQIKDYNSIAYIINELINEDFSPEQCKEVLNYSFKNARENYKLGEFSKGEKTIGYFPLIINNDENYKLWVKMEKNIREGSKKYFGAFVLTQEELKDEIFRMVSYGIWKIGLLFFSGSVVCNDFLAGLARKAMKENWEWSSSEPGSQPRYPVLKSYIEHTYYHLLEENSEEKVFSYNNKVYFNTGLLDTTFKQIFIVGSSDIIKVEAPVFGELSWKVIRNPNFYSENESEIAKVFNSNELPKITRFFNEYSEIVFDARMDIHLYNDHIYVDGIERGRLPKYEGVFESCKTFDEKNKVIARIARDFESAVDRAKLMAERNYKLAVPQYWKETGEIQFLLPIYLGDLEEAEKPQCALALRVDNSGRNPYYRGATILTLDMAYNNARLISKPDVFWLNDVTKNV